jgi:WD40 repeat protein/DNA-binding SARP family transcriptional activator
LLWPDYPEEMARSNLRHALRQLRQTLPEPAGSPPLLLTTQQIIQINPACDYTLDVAQFVQRLDETRSCTHRNLAACPECLARYHEAAQLYRGDFLAGFSLYASEPFEEWLVVQREGLHQQTLELFFTLAAYHEAQNEYDQAQHYAQRQLQLEPWREEAHRQLMRILAASGQRSTALAQFAHCRKILAKELGVEPDAETVALYDEIRTSKFGKETRRQGDKVTDAPPVTLSPPHPVTLSPQQDWGEAPATSYFYGRQVELGQLERWLLHNRCRLVAVLGLGGMGKTALVTKAARACADQFDFVFWRSLLNAPPLAELLRPCLQFLSRQQLVQAPDTLPEQLTLLLAYLTQQRCLLVLDNVESILESEQAGHYRPGYEGYGQLIEQIAQHKHQSCLVLTSRERPRGIGRLEEDLPVVRTLPLDGLSAEASQALLKTRGLTADEAQVTSLVQRYSGNPLALKLVARTIHELFDGDMAAFLGDETLMVEGLIFDDIRMVLNQQFARLSSVEREILVWLAIEREALSLPVLVQNLVQPPMQRALLEALRALQRRSLLEKSEAGFTLQNVIIEYITDYLIQQVCREITGELRAPRAPANDDLRKALPDDERLMRNSELVNSFLNRFALLKAQAKGYVRQSQIRLIVQPIAKHVLATLGKAGLVEQITQMLAALRKRSTAGDALRGYTGGNLLNLLLQLGVEPRGYDFSQICVWQAYLRGMYTPGLNLAGADLTGSAFTSIFGHIQRLHYHASGELLALGSSQGMARLWRVRDGSLLHAVTTPAGYNFVYLRGDSQIGALVSAGDTLVVVVDFVNGRVLHTFADHRNAIWRIAFSAQGVWGASGDASGQICVWEVERGQLLHRLDGHSRSITALAFAPGSAESKLLASADVSGMICLWALPTGTLLRRFQAHSEEVATLQFALGGAILASGSHDYTVRLWDLRQADPAEPVQILRRHTRPVRSMAVDPTGCVLATGGVDTFVTLWDVQSGQVLHTLADHAASLNMVAFSLDGRQVAVLDINDTIGVWDTQSGKQLDAYRIYHSAIPAIATSPDGRLLIAGGAEQSLYLWDISSPTTARLVTQLQGHRQRVESIAFSRDSVTIASGDQAGQIRVWNAHTGASRVLGSHAGVIDALAFHPDGRQLASASANGLVGIWDLQNARPPRLLRGHTNMVKCCDFSRDGRWLASGSMDRSVRLWDVVSGELRHTLQKHTNLVQQVCFYPDGSRLVSSSYDQTLCLWDVASGALLASWPTQNTTYLALAVHPNRQILAAGGRDCMVRLVDLDTGVVIEEMPGHHRAIEAVSFTPVADNGAPGDEWLLATAGHDETIKLWAIPAVGTTPDAAVCLATLRAPGPYAGMNISGATGISEAQKAALRALGAVEE